MPYVPPAVAMPLRSSLSSFCAFLCCLLASVVQLAGAQQKFTTQILILPAFRGSERGIAGRAADVVRSRVAAAYPRSELRVISGGDIDDWLRLSGFEENAQLTDGELTEMARKFRADERVSGTVTRAAGRVHIDARLELVRDLRQWQPLTGTGATVNDAAEMVAREAIAARKQLIPLRTCENTERAGKSAEAAAAAAAGIAAYPRAVPARICLLNSLAHLDVSADSVVAVSEAVLAVAPTNPIALENLAKALDSEGKSESAAPVWVRLLETDTTSEALTERVVNALARESNARLAAPLIDRGTELHPDNLPLLKLRWLVHLAFNDWKGALIAAERLLEHDAAAQSDPDFYARMATAYRADSQPARAIAIAAAGVAKFPNDAPLYITYLQLVRAENAAALPRGLSLFPDNAELHVLAAQTLRTSGNAAAALEETKRALAVNPRLPHGYLQLAQLELDANQLDSALAAINLAVQNGEDRATVSQFALARGNAMYKTATGDQKREDFQRAIRVLSLAERYAPSAQAKFLLGASALSVSQSAASEATPAKSCELSRLADSSLTDAEINLVSGGSAAPDAAKQFLDYVAKLRPYVAGQLKAFCSH